MKKVLVLVLLFLLNGCYVVDYNFSSQKELWMTDKTVKPYKVLGEFKVDTKVAWAFFGLANTTNPQMGRMVEDEINKLGGDAAINVRYTSEQSFVDGFIGCINLGLFYYPKSIQISGTVVKYE